jgi:hypothetical protein
MECGWARILMIELTALHTLKSGPEKRDRMLAALRPILAT